MDSTVQRRVSGAPRTNRLIPSELPISVSTPAGDVLRAPAPPERSGPQPRPGCKPRPP